MTELALRTLKVALNDRLNDRLCEMKSGWDDSVTGFNEAWDVVDKSFEDKIAALTAKHSDD